MRHGRWMVTVAGALALAGCGLAAAAVDDAANPARLGAWTLKPQLVSINAGGQTIGREQLGELGSGLGGAFADAPFGSSYDNGGTARTASCYEPGANPMSDIREVLNRRLIKDCKVTDETTEGNTRRAVLSCPYERYDDTGTATIATTAHLDADKASTEMRITVAVKKRTGATEQMTMRFEVDAARTGDCGSS